jgi:glycosyltransferase involved in cell wall biosynthesis
VRRQPYAPWRDGTLRYNNRVPISSPVSISTYALAHLQKSYKVRFYDWQERGPTPLYEPDDIILGHLAPDPDTIMQRFVTCDRPAAAKILLQPFAHRILENISFLLPALERVDAFGAICGPYWMDTVAASPFAPYAHLMQRVDMAINAQHYPFVRHSFSPKGKRRFLYIGHNRNPAKGCSYLSALARAHPQYAFGWLGDGPDIPSVTRISRHRRLTPSFMRSVCSEYDFLITMGVSDANPTTILECMAWGLPVICTPQSGYYNPDEVFTVELEGADHNGRILARLQEMPEVELHTFAERNRQRVAEWYTWKRFCLSVDALIDAAVQQVNALTVPDRRF